MKFPIGVKIYFDFLLIVGVTTWAETISTRSKELLKSAGCSCSPNERIKCENVFTLTGINRVVEAIHAAQMRHVKELTLNGLKIDKLPSDLCSIDIRDFILADSKIGSSPFPDCMTFKSVALQNVTLNGTDSEYFEHISHFPNVTSLGFVGMNVNLNGIEKVSQLEVIMLIQTNGSLARHLQPLENLQEVDIMLSNLDLSQLTRTHLPAAPKNLSKIRFYNSGVHELSTDFLSGLDKLAKLDLTRNQIVNVQPEALESFHGDLMINGNPLHCDELEWLKERHANGSLQVMFGTEIPCATPPGTYFLKAPPKKDYELHYEPTYVETNHSAPTFIALTVVVLIGCLATGIAYLIVTPRQQRVTVNHGAWTSSGNILKNSYEAVSMKECISNKSNSSY